MNILKWLFNPDWFTFNFGGGGGPQTSTSYQTNIPEYLQPYVTRMVESTENQVYQPGGGFRPYQSYASYDQARGGSGETVAGFTPMQSQAMRGIQGYQLPQQGQYGSMMAAGAGLGAMNAGNQYAMQATNPYSTAAYMSPYMEGAVAPQMREAARQSAMMGQQNQAQAAQQGAFGGSRSAIVEAERQRNLAQQQADIYGKGTQTAFEQARQAQQYGADLNLKGLGMGMEGGKALADIGNQQYGQQMGLLGKQLEVGNTQQQYEQNRLNQVIQDYATSQQYPFMQLGILSNMIRGQPMQAVTTQSYQAQPSYLQQGIGALGALNALQGTKSSKEGGVIKMAGGGIASGLNEYEVDNMSERLGDKQLGAKMSDPNTDPRTKQILGGEVARREQTRKAAGVGMASGGILAFADEGLVPEEETPKTKAKTKPSGSRTAFYAKEMEDVVAPALAEYNKPDAYTQGLEKSFAKAQEQSNRPLTSFMNERQEALKAAGADVNYLKTAESQQEARKREINLDVEEQDKYHQAQAWAMFGSTPGPLLVSGLKALNGYIEQTVESKKERKRLLAEVDKAIFDIKKADYQEKAGNVDAATAHRDNAAKTTIEIGEKMATLKQRGKADVLGVKAGIAEKAATAASGERQAEINAAGRANADKTTRAQQMYASMTNTYDKDNEVAIKNAQTQLDQARSQAAVGGEIPDTLKPLVASAQAVLDKQKAEHKRIAEAISNKYPEAREILMGVQMPSTSSTEAPKAAPGGVKFLGFEKT